ncbi:putative retrotransposon gag domain-containing protein [Helianthus debilis subsp. tardiflorus]
MNTFGFYLSSSNWNPKLLPFVLLFKPCKTPLKFFISSTHLTNLIEEQSRARIFHGRHLLQFSTFSVRALILVERLFATFVMSYGQSSCPVPFRCESGCDKTDSVLRLSKCDLEHQVTYIAGLLVDEALSWWNHQVWKMGETAAYAMTWDELKDLMRKRYCSRAEVQKLETELWNLKMEGPKIAEYVQRFNELSQVALLLGARV